MNRVSIPEDIARRAGAVVKPESRSGGDTLTTVPAAPIPAPILETKFSDSPGVKQLSIALIGPNEPRRWDVSSVLAECRGITVREFSSYPTALDDVPRLLERYFDVIIVDLDSDPEFAPKLVSTISTETSATVMVYSEKADRELMARCVRAGAREYLVLPFDQSTLGKALDRARIELDSKAPSKETADGDLLVFFGAKGGAGVTTVACNLALALAREPDRKTLLIDLAVPMGDAALNLGIAAEYSTDDALREADRLDADASFYAPGLRTGRETVLAAPSQVSEVDPAQGSHRQTGGSGTAAVRPRRRRCSIADRFDGCRSIQGSIKGLSCDPGRHLRAAQFESPNFAILRRGRSKIGNSAQPVCASSAGWSQ